MNIKDIQLPIESAQTLQRARKQRRMVERAHERYRMEQAERPIISSPELDRMPKGTHLSSGLERRYIGLEKYRQRIEREEKALKEVQEEARRIIYSLPDILQDFCFWYYIEGLTMQKVAAWLDRDISTCWRYKRVLEQNAL